MSRFEEGLGRIVYVAGALEFERPFLGPLYRFLTIHPRNSVRRAPPYVGFILRHLSVQVERSRHYQCAAELVASEVAPRVDAQASGERTGIGGWYPVMGEDGQPDPKKISMVQLGNETGPLPVGVREGRPTFSDHLHSGSPGGPRSTEGVLPRRCKRMQEEGSGDAYLDGQSG